MTVVNLEPKYNFIWDKVVFMVYHANMGEGHEKHHHPYAHGIVCFAGKIKVTKQNLSVELTSDNEAIRLAEDEWHEIEALEDNTIFVNIFTDGKY